MPTQARFGRLPRSAPSLTSTIVALAQEYQRVRESNIVDAWKNGGEFEGKPVHDKDILAWMKARRDELSPDDPKWDYYDNQVTQYEFAIDNSKQELEYKRGNKTDAQMAAYYHSWANKLPKDSEAYREREKLAASYADRASQGRAASGRAAADKAYANNINASYKKEFAYDAQLAFLTNEAMNRGILRDNESIGNIDPNTADGRAINALWNEIATSPEYADERAFYTKQIKDHGEPGFNGDFSQDAFNARERTKTAAVNDRITTARKAGRETDVKNFTEEKGVVRGTRLITQGWDETQLYEESRAEWIKTFENPNATPLEIDRANTKYINDLNVIKGRLESQKGPGEVDPRLGFVNNELRTMSGDEAPLEHWGGAFGPGGNSGLDHATETAIGVKQNQTEIKQLTERDANGEPLYVLSKTYNGEATATNDKNFAASSWGVVPRNTLPAETMFIIQNDSGDPRAGKIITAVMPTPIHVVSNITNPTTGEQTPKTGDTPAAWHYMMPDGSTGYRFIDKAGNVLYTRDNPFVTTNPDGTTTDNPVTVAGKQATVNVQGNGYVVPNTDTVINPNFYDPAKSVAMPGSIAKSGYSLWLMTSDPKKNQAYSQKPEDIFATLSLEAGGNTKLLTEMVVEADQRRAIYIGTSTEEQNRIRQNALNGIKGPVPLSEVATRHGIKTPSAEQAAINALTAGRTKDQIGEDLTRGNLMQGLRDKGMPFMTPDASDWLRKTSMVPTPPKPAAAGPTQSPTSMGSDIPSQIAKGLGDIFGNLFGHPVPGGVGSTVPPPLGITPRPAAGPPPPKPTTPPPAPKPTPPPPAKPVAPPPKPLPVSMPGNPYLHSAPTPKPAPVNLSPWRINGPR